MSPHLIDSWSRETHSLQCHLSLDFCTKYLCFSSSVKTQSPWNHLEHLPSHKMEFDFKVFFLHFPHGQTRWSDFALAEDIYSSTLETGSLGDSGGSLGDSGRMWRWSGSLFRGLTGVKRLTLAGGIGGGDGVFSIELAADLVCIFRWLKKGFHMRGAPNFQILTSICLELR